MMSALNQLLSSLLSPPTTATPILPLTFPDLTTADPAQALTALNTAFLIILAGESHPQFLQAKTYLSEQAVSGERGSWANFYLTAIRLMADELEQVCQQQPLVRERLQAAVATLQGDVPLDDPALAETLWVALFPPGVGIRGQEDQRVQALRQTRRVAISELNPTPLTDPTRQLLFTSNVLLTVPLVSTPVASLNFDDDFKAELETTLQEPQKYWYDHPIPIGVAPESNEILYGLKALNQAVADECERHPEFSPKLACALSVSVTHGRLQTLGKAYLQQVLGQTESLDHLEIFAFTEADTEALFQQVLLPALEHYCGVTDAAELHSVFGVDGRYGRHYSFLKAIAAIWNLLVDSEIKGTFKIDLDQVFPQAELVEQTGCSAFEHFQTPLWGAKGQDAWGQPIELGMIAGALVNQKDIHRGVFTPDVPFPNRPLTADEYVFFSPLPQALSTTAEMMTRYLPDTDLDGRTTCLQRIHVTGGTNGILVNSLRQFRPFTPSFIGRAEDQAYLLSTLPQDPPRLGYVHASGLIMRHDKEGFAQEAIKLAKVGKQIGDYIRILLFSAYAQALSADITPVKTATDPFTGCFISELPITVALLRFALKVGTLTQTDQLAEATEFITTGVPQLLETITFMQRQDASLSPLQQTYAAERHGWDQFYDGLDALETALCQGDPLAASLRETARQIVINCRVN